MDPKLWHLPPEIVALIVANVDTIKDLYQWAFTSKFFYTVSIPALWKAPGVRYSPTKLILNYLGQSYASPLHNQLSPTPLGHHIRELWFSANDSTGDFLSLLTLTPLVEDLYFDIYDIPMDTNQIAHLCPNLRKLCIGVPYISDESIKPFVRACPRLTELCLLSCGRLSLETILALKDSGVERLYIEQCPKLMVMQVIPHLARLVQLTSLRIYHDVFYISTDFIPRLVQMAATLPLLTDFYISRYQPSNDLNENRQLISFIRSHPNLERLGFGYFWMNDMILLTMARYLPKLRYLDLNFCRNVGVLSLRLLVKDCSRLVFVSLDGCGIDSSHFVECENEEKEKRQLDRHDIKRIRLGLLL